jgi:hypothetical protein
MPLPEDEVELRRICFALTNANGKVLMSNPDEAITHIGRATLEIIELIISMNKTNRMFVCRNNSIYKYPELKTVAKDPYMAVSEMLTLFSLHFAQVSQEANKKFKVD